jgi:hypothetical protein
MKAGVFTMRIGDYSVGSQDKAEKGCKGVGTYYLHNTLNSDPADGAGAG